MKRYIILDLDGTLIDSEWVLEKEILKEFQTHRPDYVDKVRYFWNTLNGMGYRDFLTRIFENSEDIIFMEEKIKRVIEECKSNFTFFPWAVDTVRLLSLNYTLFLSTGNYTENAVEILKNAGIHGLFAHIQWSEIFSKSPLHISIFKDMAMDPDFEKYTLSVGDGDVEKSVAETCKIDFIQVWVDAKHMHKIPTISELPKYLANFSDTDSLDIGEQNYIL